MSVRRVAVDDTDDPVFWFDGGTGTIVVPHADIPAAPGVDPLEAAAAELRRVLRDFHGGDATIQDVYEAARGR